MLNVVNLPNFLTLLRLLAVPLFLILLESLRFRDALLVFIAAGITDGLDGAIARLTHTKTTLGAFLDPIADKLLLVSAFIALGFMHEVPRWLVVIVISRDVIIVLGYVLLFMLTSEMMEIQPSVSGKASTFFQLLAVSMVLVSLVQAGLVSDMAQQVVFSVAGAVTTFAGLQYMYRGLVWFQSHEQAPSTRQADTGAADRKPTPGRRRA